jgi:hypothetical protein
MITVSLSRFKLTDAILVAFGIVGVLAVLLSQSSLLVKEDSDRSRLHLMKLYKRLLPFVILMKRQS